MKRTGEQVVATERERDELFGEISFRYGLAKPYCEKKKVLDVGCGTGIGTILLADTAKAITGLDHSEDALRYALENCRKDNITYLNADVDGTMPIKSKSKDVILAFELIEHLKNYKLFLKECKRILKKGGYLILSTPNAQGNDQMHSWHIKEFAPKELKKELNQIFNKPKITIQGIRYGDEFMDRLKKSKKTSGLVAKTPSYIKNMIPPFLRIWIAKILGFNASKDDFTLDDIDQAQHSYVVLKK